MPDETEPSVRTAADGVHRRRPERLVVRVREADIAADHRRGGVIRTMLSPRNAGSVSGFLGVARLEPGERIAEHYHPYSEEFLYVADGELTVDLDGEPWNLECCSALLIPPGTRHRLRNEGPVPARVVFQLGPLAPRPELGHVDTEPSTTSGGRDGGGT
ncbi:cupin domain-containing protein [Saccharomonospora xinjiangensis]|uniref:Cupin domain-containing protein n=1 Tax=Saccharomonospora xinjiangensis XJ-54 TaxID=882086 RepID=I0V8V3_9PSEU|nr:cupin domain-containing protein [Saccharomonospora xinjiangensis]EID56556.1 cupin domain-containing protein [Saccharomonospora xinjiangensis XJ-54]